jgi:uncharacterized protein with PQ loop repeat
MTSDSITHEESLAIIESMINKAKNQFSDDGFMYLLWGWVILFCSVAQYILKSILHVTWFEAVWMLTWLAFLVQLIYIYRTKRRLRVRTYADELVGYVWVVFVIMLVLGGTVLSKKLEPSQFYIANILILVLYGMPTFLSGIILKFKPLVWGGTICWVLSLIACFVPADFIVLLIAIAVISAWIVPGYVLQNKYKKENLQ